MPFNTEINSFDMQAFACDNKFGSYDNPYSNNIIYSGKKDKHFSKFFKKRKKSRK